MALSAAARSVFDNLTEAQKNSLWDLYGTPSTKTAGEVSEILLNGDFIDQFLSFLGQRRPYDSGNQLIQEAARIGNLLLKSQRYSGDLRFNIQSGYTYDSIFPTRYNRELIALIARFSGSEALVNGINTFVGDRNFTNSTLLNEVFPAGGKNTDLLGLRAFNYANLTGERLNYQLGQGRVVFGKDITLSDVNLDLTDTNLSEVLGTADRGREETRLFAISALADMRLSGRINLLNNNERSRSGWSVVSLGAMGSVTIADNTEIYNASRVLALGGGKVKGTENARISGLKLSSGDSIAVASGSDLWLSSVSFNILRQNPTNRVILFAENTLDLAGASFTGMRGEIFMEARTLNLSDTNLPGGVSVKLVSQDGGTADGYTGRGFYPYFGAGQSGRVNFGTGVLYNGYLIASTDDFDLYGTSIFIGSISDLPNLNASRDAFASGLKNANVFRRLSETQQVRFMRLAETYRGTGRDLPAVFPTDSILSNAELMENYPSVLDDVVKYRLLNPLLQEAAIVGNSVIESRTYAGAVKFESKDGFTYDKLFANGYNKALLLLLAKYSKSDRLFDGVNAFVEGKNAAATINNSTTLSSLFTANGPNTDLLGLRPFNYANLTGERLNYQLGQGRVVFGKDITLSDVNLDLTDTNLSEVLRTWNRGREETRLFAISALADMRLSGRINLLNNNERSRSGWSVVSLGAMGSVTIADSTEIYNASRVLALGGGKLKGTETDKISGLKLFSGDSIAVGSGSNLSLSSVSFNILQDNPTNRVLLFAQRTLDLSSASFVGMRGEVFMEAKTLNISDTKLPGGVSVKLVSEYGGTADGISGKGFYPYFGSGQLGRVSFGKAVLYDGYPISNTDEFDLYGASIVIGSISDLPNLNASRDAFANPLQNANAFRRLGETQQVRFMRMAETYRGTGKNMPALFPTDSVLSNAELMEKYPAVLDDVVKYRLLNPLLQEAAIVGNSLIKSRTDTGLVNFDSKDAFTYDKLFANGYNKALLLLLAKYSNSDRLFDGVNTFVVGKNAAATINNDTTLSTLFTADGPNTDLLGLSKVDYFSLKPEKLVQTLGQGETFFSRNWTIQGSGSGEVVLDVTNTKVKDATAKAGESRLVAMVALGDASVSGRITVKNQNPDAAKTRNVIAIGAVNSLKVADNTKIVNEGRVLAVGAGKLRSDGGGDRIAGIDLESKGEILVGSGKNMHLVDAKFKVSGNRADLILYARDTMTLENPSFNFPGKSAIFMEATTVNLSDVNFPGGSKVTLVSRDGGTSDGLTGTGKYPKFGSPVVGRVNFIQNVRYDSNLIGNTGAFDLHGTSISVRSPGSAGTSK